MANFDKNPDQYRRMAQRQKGLRKKLKRQSELHLEDNCHIGSQDVALAGWDLTFENVDEEFEQEIHERKRGK